jgi:hypothetical protein
MKCPAFFLMIQSEGLVGFVAFPALLQGRSPVSQREKAHLEAFDHLISLYLTCFRLGALGCIKIGSKILKTVLTCLKGSPEVRCKWP